MWDYITSQLLNFLSSIRLKVSPSSQVTGFIVVVRHRRDADFAAPAGCMQEVIIPYIDAHMGNSPVAVGSKKDQIAG